MIDLYSKWGNYIPTDLRKQFEAEWLEVEKILVKNNVDLGSVSNSLLDWCTCTKEPMWLVGGRCVSCNRPRKQ